MRTVSHIPQPRATIGSVLTGFRPWHPLVGRSDRFHWMLGLRVALCFVGPIALSHMTGQWVAQTSLFSFGGLIVTLFASTVAGWQRSQLLASLGLTLVLPAGVAVAMVVHGAGRIALLVAAGLLAGRGVGWGRTAATYASAVGIAMVIAPEFPSTALAATWVWLGGLFAVVVALLLTPLTPSHLRPKDRAAAVHHRLVTHHSIRLAVALGIAGVVAELAGESSPIRAHALWMGTGVWIVLQPQLHDTVTKGVQRAFGTIVGGVLTLALVAVLPAGFWPGWLFLGASAVCFGLRSVNYGWYCAAFTPIVVMGFGPITHDHAVLEARLGWTVLGCLLALAVRFALWPTAAHQPSPAPS